MNFHKKSDNFILLTHDIPCIRVSVTERKDKGYRIGGLKCH